MCIKLSVSHIGKLSADSAFVFERHVGICAADQSVPP